MPIPPEPITLVNRQAPKGTRRESPRLRLESEKRDDEIHVPEFLRVVDHAAAMNDRWLFLAAFFAVWTAPAGMCEAAGDKQRGGDRNRFRMHVNSCE